MTILTNKPARNIITLLIYALIAFFIFKYLGSLDFSKLTDVHFNWWYLLTALPFSVLSRIFLPYIWIQLISMYKAVDTTNEYWQLNYIYAKSWLGKYLPGKVTWVGGKIYFALGRGLSKTVLGITSLVEIALQILTALILGVAFLFISGAYSNFSIIYNMFFLGASIIGLFAISPPIFNRLLRYGYTILKKKKLSEHYFVKLHNILKIGGFYFGVHALSSLPIYFLVKSIGVDITFIQLIYVSGAFIFAGAVGTLALFAPSGLGVREGIILLFLSTTFPPEVSVVLVIVLRIWSVLLDVGYWLLSYILIKTLDKKSTT